MDECTSRLHIIKCSEICCGIDKKTGGGIINGMF